MKQKPNKKQNGFSLIEVTITLLLVGVIFVLYASALNVVAVTRKLRYENIAYHIANKEIEILRNTSYEDLPSSGSISDTLLAGLPSGGGTYTIADHASMSNMKEVTVSVVWADPVSKEVRIKTLMGTGGINPWD
ncbi:MAG: prepilin-type N-terminal cleavage/methylation domain-containing protein [Candidatus Doudnabacteria bacterium]|nr:prepilin-type N-terminal cleavage/methylation domain-containing protein [Candidatus Doudnabacteria bacterium]